MHQAATPEHKTLPEWMKSLPNYHERPGLFAHSLYPGTVAATVDLAGVKWGADSHEGEDPALCHHPAEDRLLYVRRATPDSFSWRACLILKPEVLYININGTAATAEDAACAAIAVEFRKVSVDGVDWYAGTWGVGFQWSALGEDGKPRTVLQHPTGGFEWIAPFDGIEIFKSAGVQFDNFHGDSISGYAESLEDAARAIKDAPATLRAACRAYLARSVNN